MASQTDVQQLVQGLSSGSNNGNPNTAYNNSPGTPLMDAQGNWFLQNLPTAASLNMGNRSTGGMPTMPSLPPVTGVGGGGWGFPPPPPTTTPGTTTPPPTQGVPPPAGTPGGTYGDGGGVNIITTPHSPYVNSPMSDGTGSWAGGSGGSVYNNSVFDTSTWGNGMNAAEFLQGATGGVGISLELLDKLSEIFLPGNIVQSGQINWRQLFDSLATKLSGGLTDAVKQLLGGSPLVQNYNNWVQGGYAPVAGDTRFGGVETGNTSGWGFGQVNPLSGQLSLGLLNQGLIPQATPVPTANNYNTSELMASIFGNQINNPMPGGHTYGGLSSFSANSPYYGSLTGEAARNFVSGFSNARPENIFDNYIDLN